jgi:Immunity protein 15
MGRVVIGELEQPFRAAFDALLAAEGHTQLSDYLEVTTFDEVPLYSRFDQLSFLDGLDSAEQNRLLIRAAVLHLAKIVDYAGRAFEGRDDPCLRMVSITGWWDSDADGWTSTDGTTRLLTPNFWIGNLRSAQMQSFTMDSASGKSAQFVADALDRDPDYVLFEGWSAPGPDRFLRRVYVQLNRV